MAAAIAAAVPRPAVAPEKSFQHAHVCLPDNRPAAASPVAMNFRVA